MRAVGKGCKLEHLHYMGLKLRKHVLEFRFVFSGCCSFARPAYIHGDHAGRHVRL